MKESLRYELLGIRTIEEWREASELMGRMLTHLKGIAVSQFKVGDKVYFISSKTQKKVCGVVKKVNSVAIKVDAGADGQWRVSGTCLHLLK
jgi:hypothetical protein